MPVLCLGGGGEGGGRVIAGYHYTRVSHTWENNNYTHLSQKCIHSFEKKLSGKLNKQ